MSDIKKLDRLLQSFLEKGPVGCACTVVHKGKKVYEGYFGYADLDAKKPISPDTIYRVYSMTKVITCVAALKLYEQGLYLLGDPIEEYLPEFKDLNVYRTDEKGRIYVSPAASPILVKDLFSMSSGITYEGDETETERQMKIMMKTSDKLDTRSLVKEIAKIPLAFDPGTHWKYGMSHDVLGAFIEVLSGKTFGQFVKDEIFDPLGMNDSSFRIVSEKKDRLCCRYDRSEDGTLTLNQKEAAFFLPGSLYDSGGGGILSTLSDYMRFAQALASGGILEGTKLLGRKTIQLMASNQLDAQRMQDFNWPQMRGYGYGLGVRTMVNPPVGGCNGTPGEFGWSGLLGTWAMIDPQEELAAVYMQQMFPNLEPIQQPRMRSVIYGALD